MLVREHNLSLQGPLVAGSSRCRVLSLQGPLVAGSSRCRVLSLQGPLVAGSMTGLRKFLGLVP
jgi:hypothetical protein